MTLRNIQLVYSPPRFSLVLRKSGERNAIDVFPRRSDLALIVKASVEYPPLPLPPATANTAPLSDLVALYAVRDLGGHRLVVSVGAEWCDYADHDNPSHAGKVVGITIAAASMDALARINTDGIVDELSWNWVPGEDIWLVNDGLMTQTPPMDGAFIQRIGYALSTSRIRLTLDDPIFL